MSRFPLLTVTLAAVTIYALWGRALLVAVALLLAVVFAYHVGRSEGRAEILRERDAELMKLLEPTDEEIAQMERERGFRA